MADLAGILADLEAESAELDALVADLDAAGWATADAGAGLDRSPTRSRTWPGPTSSRCVRRHRSGRLRAPSSREAPAEPDGLRRRRAAAERRRAAAGRAAGRLAEGRARAWPTRWRRPGRSAKIPWFGPPMSAASMATARLMETWAHGQDVADALGRASAMPTARLRHVAHLGVRTRDFAYRVARPARRRPSRSASS